MRLRRRVLVPTLLLAAVVAGVLGYGAWGSLERIRALERDAAQVRTATALAFALDDAAHEEDRWVVSIRAGPRGLDEPRLDDATGRISGLVGDLQAMPLAPRPAATLTQFLETRTSMRSIRGEIVEAARRGDSAAIALSLDKWHLMSNRSDALLKSFGAYYLRFLDRTVRDVERRSARALWDAALGIGVGLLLAIAFSLAVARTVVRPLVAVADAAERIAATGETSPVAGAERRDEAGKLARSFNEMTERLVTANARLAEADRRKDEFLGMLSHELRNPLAPIRNSVHVLERVDPASDAGRRALESIDRQTRHLTRLVDDLLDVTRIARGKIHLNRTLVELRGVVRDAAEDFRVLMESRGLRFQTALPPAEVWAQVDVTRVTQVIGNLLHNAAKFTPVGGKVDLSLRASGEVVEIQVRDSGAGIDPAVLPHVFDAFVQGHRTLARTDGGLGLGLALVKGVAELHGGSVRAASSGTAQGAEFTVALPVAAASAGRGRAEDAGHRQERACRRVLVVDDNVDAAESLADLVKLLGHAVEIAYDGPSAIEKARVSQPEVVLCDIGLPGISGYDVAKALREHCPGRVKLFAVSGYAQPEDVRRAEEAGFDGHVAKPPDPREIARLLG